MKIVITILAHFAMLIQLGLSSPEEFPEKAEQYKTYGLRGEDTISVFATGNFRNPGEYHIKKGTGLKVFYGICGGHGGLGDFGGGPPKTLIIRRPKGEKLEEIRVELRSLQLADTNDVELKNGDSIYANSRIF